MGAARLGSVLENGKQSRSVASNCGKFREVWLFGASRDVCGKFPAGKPCNWND